MLKQRGEIEFFTLVTGSFRTLISL
uniref:Uncharacterized protein n=1 Tax=Anguilla anguilla TaxID=7936 RepID=A0A0E9UPV5_ANGAN